MTRSRSLFLKESRRDRDPLETVFYPTEYDWLKEGNKVEEIDLDQGRRLLEESDDFEEIVDPLYGSEEDSKSLQDLEQDEIHNVELLESEYVNGSILRVEYGPESSRRFCGSLDSLSMVNTADYFREVRTYRGLNPR